MRSELDSAEVLGRRRHAQVAVEEAALIVGKRLRTEAQLQVPGGQPGIDRCDRIHRSKSVSAD